MTAPRTRLGPAARFLTLTVLCAYCLLPILWLLIASTKSTSDLFGTPGFAFAKFQLLGNLKNLQSYDGAIYFRWLINSIVYAGGGALVSTVLSVMAGMALAKYDFRGRRIVYGLVLSGVLVPITALALPLFLIATELGLTDNYASVLIPSFVSPFSVYLASVYIEQMAPDEMLEAGRIDGAGEARIFLSLVIPNLGPALITLFLFSFVGIWNNFFLPLVMLSDDKLYPVTLGLAQLSSTSVRDPLSYSLTVVGSAISVIPLVGAIVVLQKFWRSGLISGSVKA